VDPSWEVAYQVHFDSLVQVVADLGCSFICQVFSVSKVTFAVFKSSFLPM